MPPDSFFFVVGIGSTWRCDPIFSLHIFCWAGNGYFSSQTVFTDTKNIFSKKKKKSPDFGRNFGTQNTQGPLVLLLNMIIGGVKIVEQCSDFVYSPWFK